MIRRLFTAASVISLLAFIAVVALWIRSMSRSDMITRGRTDPPQDVRNWRFGTAHGALFVDYAHILGASRVDSSSVFPLEFEHQDENQQYHADEMEHHFAGFGWERVGYVVPDRFYTESVAIPLWAFLLALLLPPIFMFRWLWRTRRVEGHCPACGYDLRASTERCPECGTPILMRGMS